jgi:DNA-binding transcriptional MerR regulator
VFQLKAVENIPEFDRLLGIEVSPNSCRRCLSRSASETTVATLSNWERRYGLVVPIRTNGGQRLFSREHIDKLIWVKEQLDRGLSAAEAHGLLANDHTHRDQVRGRRVTPAEVRAEARQVRADAAAAHARAAAEQARTASILANLAAQASGAEAHRLRAHADQASQRDERTRCLAADSAQRAATKPPNR